MYARYMIGFGAAASGLSIEKKNATGSSIADTAGSFPPG
jgi:hypothetical protein